MLSPLRVAGKLERPGRLNAVAAGLLIHVTDQLSSRRFLIDTGAAFSIIPYSSASPTSGPQLSGPSGKQIRCWGETAVDLQLSGQSFSWKFLRAAVSFPIIGVDFLRAHGLLVDPVNNRLVSAAGLALQGQAVESTPSASVIVPIPIPGSSSVPPRVARAATTPAAALYPPPGRPDPLHLPPLRLHPLHLPALHLHWRCSWRWRGGSRQC